MCIQDEVSQLEKFCLCKLMIPEDASEYENKAAALMQMMFSYPQRINLALLLKMRM